MGGGDLNLKKSWHPLTVRNQEIVWKLEQEKEDEDKKARRYEKELKRERQIQDLKKLQVDSGIIHSSSTTEKMEWMYASTSQQSPSYQDDFLLGKRNMAELLDASIPTIETSNFLNKNIDSSVAQIPSISTSLLQIQKDMETKLREDPLFAIKKKEQEALKKPASSNSKTQASNDYSSRSSASEWSSRSNRSISTPLRGNVNRVKKPQTWSMSEEERNARLLEMREDARRLKETKSKVIAVQNNKE